MHVHTKGTSKNDQFKSPDFDSFCRTLFHKAIEKSVAAIGVTDYFSVENYKQVRNFVESIRIAQKEYFTDAQIEKIENILLLPNVELRILPVTDAERLVNIHCIFNPKIVDQLDDTFFGKLETKAGGKGAFPMTESGIIRLGRHMNPQIDSDLAAYQLGIDNFALSHSDLLNVINQDEELEENCFIVVSNSSNDGASAFRRHYDLFEHEASTGLDGTRRAIYSMSDFLFSGNPKDRAYFSGNKSDTVEQICEKIKSLKPCIHGSDAHTEEELFEPDLQRYCWIKADPTFEGLRQIKYEPTERVFIGETPDSIRRVIADKTRYFNSLEIAPIQGKSPSFGSWFGHTSLKLNSELVAIIGNKGGGKSAIADVIGFLGNSKKGIVSQDYSFLTPLRFKQKGLADCFDGTLVWEDESESSDCLMNNPDPTSPERVQYIPQNFFETLTNELTLTKFESELKRVVFSHLPESSRAGKETFEDLEQEKTLAIEREIHSIKLQIDEGIKEMCFLEKLQLPEVLEATNKEIETKKMELDAHVKSKPAEPPSSDVASIDQASNNRIRQINSELDTIDNSIQSNQLKLTVLSNERESFKQALVELKALQDHLDDFKQRFSELLEKRNIEPNSISFNYDRNLIQEKLLEVDSEFQNLERTLNSAEAINEETAFDASGDERREQLENASLIITRSKLVSERDILKEKISQPARERQNYLEALRVWKTKKAKLEGSVENPNADTSSIAYLENKKRYIENDLENKLTELRLGVLDKSKQILSKKSAIIDLYNEFKAALEKRIQGLSSEEGLAIGFESAFKLDNDICKKVLRFFDGRKKGTFNNSDAENHLEAIFDGVNFQTEDGLASTIEALFSAIDVDLRSDSKNERRFLANQIPDPEEFLKLIYGLDYLRPVYRLELDGKDLRELSPGEKGALLLVFYLTLDKESVPLIIDQPEDNLDNQTVYKLLTRFIKEAKKHRQIVIVTHNPNLAIGADAEQIIYVNLDKSGNHKFSYVTGSIENPKVNAKVVEVLEGTMPAFDKRRLKYIN